MGVGEGDLDLPTEGAKWLDILPVVTVWFNRPRVATQHLFLLALTQASFSGDARGTLWTTINGL